MIVSFGSTLLLVLPPFRGILARERQKTLFPSLPNIMRNIMLPLLRIRLLSTKIDLLFFIQTADPTKVRVGETQRVEGEPKLLDTTMGRVVPLLLVDPARASSELEASVDKLFDEGGSGSHAEQGDSVSSGHAVGIPQVSETAEIVAEDAAPVQPRRQRKRKMVVSGAGEPSHPPKKLREDHGTSNGPSVAKREDGDQTDFMAGANLRTITAPPRFVISSDSSHHSGANIAEDEVDSFARPSIPLMTMTTTVTSTIDPTTTAKEKFVESSVFGGGSSSEAKHTVGGFSSHTGSDFIFGGIHAVVSPDTDLQKVYVPQWSVTNGSCLDDGRTCREMVDEFAPLKFFTSIHGMEHDELFTEFDVGAARQISLSAEVRMRAEFNIREKRRLSVVVEEKISFPKARGEEGEKSELDVKVADLAATVKVREEEVADLDAMVTSVKVHTLEVSSIGLQEKVIAYESFIGRLEKFQDDRMREMNENFDKLDIDLVELALHLEERFYPHLLTIIVGRRWLLSHGLELAIAKCLNSTKYLSFLGAAIGKAVEKGMQEGLSAGITHDAEGRVLTDVAAYNPSAKADYLTALQCLQSVNFSLITELKSNKDASIDTIMNLLCLEDSLAERLGLIESQPRVDQLMVPIHHSPDQRVICASALSLSLDVSSSRVQRIRENIANHTSALRDVFVPLSEPLSATTLMGTEVISATIDTPIAPSTTLAFSVPNDATGGNVNPFPNVDDVELNVSQ
ncbi:hypothetical protein Tco_0945371 [Tanacetum coccineum]